MGLKKWPTLYKQLSEEGASVKLQRVRVKSFISGSTAEVAETEFADEIRRNIKGGLSSLASVMMGQLGIEGRPGKAGTIGPAFQGEIFEESMRMAMKAAEALPGAAFDFEANGPPSLTMSKIFGRPISRIDAKRRMESAAGAQHGIPKKYFNDIGTAPEGVSEIVAQRAAMLKEAGIYNRPMTSKGEYSSPFKKMLSKGKVPGSASGFVPNFSPLTSAISREMQAGVPASAIRVGSSSALKSAGNPGGVGVYNTIHEPGGLNQGISRSKAQGINPKSHGVPNFYEMGTGAPMLPSSNVPSSQIAGQTRGTYHGGPGSGASETAKIDAESAKTTAKAAGKFEKASNGILMASMMVSMAAPAMGSAMGARPSTQGMVSAGANIASMTGMGLAMTGGNPLGALGGAALGAVTSMGDLQMAFGEKGRIADAKQIQDQTKAIGEGIEGIAKALATLGNLDFATVEQKLTQYNKVQQEIIEVQKLLLEGGGTAAPARKAFFESGLIQKAKSSSPSQLTPDDYAQITKETAKMRARAEANLSTGDKNQFRGNMVGWSGDLAQLRIREGKLPNTVTGETYKETYPDEEFRRTKLQESQTGLAGKIVGPGGAFSANVQTQMALAAGEYQKHSRLGVNPIEKYKQQMDSGDVLEAAKTIAPILRASGKEVEADALNKMAKDEDFQNLTKTAQGTVRLGQMVAGEDRTAMGRESGMAVLQQLEYAREQNLMGLFHKDFRTKKSKPQLTDAEIKSLEDERVASILALNAPRDTSRAGGRAAGFTLASGVAGRRRGVGFRAQGRTQGMQLAASQGMFGDRLFNKMEGLKLEGAFDTYNASMADISAAEKTAVKKADATAGDAYLKALQEGEMKASMRKAAGDELDLYRAMPLGQKEKERKRLRKEEAYNKTAVGSAQIEYLTSVIDAEVKARETAVHKEGEAALDYQANSKKVQDNTKHLKAMEEATKHFYSGAHIYNLEKERSVLGEKIQFQEKEVAAGKLNVAVLHESKMKFEDLNDAIDGTGRQLELLDQRFNQILTGVLTDKEIKDATVDAKKSLGNQIKSRQLSGAGAAGIVANAEEAFSANQITSSELRSIKANARLNAPGATGNPMEAFRDQFLYNGREAMLDFESGVIGVADTMKNSFTQAFRSLTSGASSAEEAFAGMAVSILDSISDMSGQMATKMLFNQMNSYFGAQGGLVPRYNQGGVVTGGSGHKDDVLSLMSGGEFVIKKSSAQKIGYGTLNAINSGGARGYAEGGSTAGAAQKGPGMGSMMAVSAGASALSGLISQANQPDPKKPWRGENYGFGRGKYGYFGGPEHDAGRSSSIAGGGGSAQVSLNKGFAYYRRDPQTGRLISERARPTEGRFEVSSALSLRGRLGEGDPQTSRMFSKEQSMGNYQDYLFDETKRRKDVVKAHEKMKQGRRISAWANAAMLIGGSYMMGKTAPMTSDLTGASVSGQGHKAFNALSSTQRAGMSANEWLDQGVGINDSGIPDMAGGGSAKSSAAMLMGGEYVMSPQTVRTYGAGFMQELNRGNVPQMAGGGFVGGQGVGGGMISGGDTNNNVNINVNVDKRGSVKADAGGPSGENSDNAQRENTLKQTENNKDLGKALQTVVLQELIRQQRPGGLLTKG